jgi:hypothetical protein
MFKTFEGDGCVSLQKYKKFWGELIAYFPLNDTERIENEASNKSSVAECVFVAAVMFLPSRCSVTVGEFTYGHTDRWEGFMKYAIEMGSSTMIYIPSFMKTGSAIQKLTGAGYKDTQRARQSHKPTFIFQKK